ncbi:hypothetical protein GCM10010193_08070 [Kitasatospora atroaurantiaca]
MLPGESVAASTVADLAAQLLALDERIGGLDKQIKEAFHAHPQANVIESMPGIGPILGAEFIVAAGDLASYADAGRLASAAGLVPVPRDSGRRTGNLHRPKRYSRRLRRVFYLSAQTSIIKDGPNRDFYLKKRAEGCKHVQALIALARRRVNVLWALLRDGREFTPPSRSRRRLDSVAETPGRSTHPLRVPRKDGIPQGSMTVSTYHTASSTRVICI